MNVNGPNHRAHTHDDDRRARTIRHPATAHAERELAWDLAEHSRSWLSITDLNTVFIKLACDDYLAAVEVTLTAIVRARATVPENLAQRLSWWIIAYRGHNTYARLRALVDRASCNSIDPCGLADG